MLPIQRQTGGLRATARDRRGLGAEVREPAGQHPHPAEPPGGVRLRRAGDMREPQRPRGRPRRQHPPGVLVPRRLPGSRRDRPAGRRVGTDRRPRRQPCGGQPVRLVGEVSGRGRARLEHAERPPAAGQDGADGNGFGESDPQVAGPGGGRLAERHAFPMRLPPAGPNEIRRPVEIRRDHRGLPPVLPLGEGGRVQHVPEQRRGERFGNRPLRGDGARRHADAPQPRDRTDQIGQFRHGVFNRSSGDRSVSLDDKPPARSRPPPGRLRSGRSQGNPLDESESSIERRYAGGRFP